MTRHNFASGILLALSPYVKLASHRLRGKSLTNEANTSLCHLSRIKSVSDIRNIGFQFAGIMVSCIKNIHLKHDLNPVKLQIGDIRDIAIAVPMQNFLNLDFVKGNAFRFPMSEEGEAKTIFDSVVEQTREMMGRYKTSGVTSL